MSLHEQKNSFYEKKYSGHAKYFLLFVDFYLVSDFLVYVHQSGGPSGVYKKVEFFMTLDVIGHSDFMQFKKKLYYVYVFKTRKA